MATTLSIVLISILGFFVILLLLLSYVIIPQFIADKFSKKPTIGAGRADWMGNLPQKIKNKPINQIILPGTHDSGSHQLLFSVKPDINPPVPATPTTSTSLITAPSTADYFNLAAKASFITPVKSLMNNWTLTQNFSIAEQLFIGIRVFDLRLMFTENKWYLSHTFVCELLEDVLNQIKEFLFHHPNEVLIIMFSFDYEGRKSITEEKQNHILQVIQKSFKEKIIYPNKDLLGRCSFPTLTDILKTSGRIIIYFDLFQVVDPSSIENTKFLWPEKQIGGTWINTSDVNVKLLGLEAQLLNFKPSNSSNKSTRGNPFNILWFTLTPQTQDIKNSILLPIGSLISKKRSTFEITQQIQDALPTFINNVQPKNITNKTSAILTDFPNLNFVDSVIQLNV